MFEIQEGDNVIFTWGNSEEEMVIKTMMFNIKDLVGSKGSMAVDCCDNLIDSHFEESLFEIAILDDSHGQTNISLPLLGEYLRILKMCGKLFIRINSSTDTLLSNLKLSGYCNIEQSINCEENFSEIKAFKPDFEVGSTMKLSLKSNRFIENGTFKLDLEDPDVELENPDDLLSEEDLQRPDPSSLKVCGTTGKKKACKNCVCGLKEELDAENEAKAKENKDFKPSCGSCYLGDAFRCASCPYLGTPAFKPGEKVKLAEDTMQDDF